MPTIFERLKHGWDAFRNNKDPTMRYEQLGFSSYYRPDRVRLTRGNERSIVTSIYNRIATDVAAIPIKHIRVDDNGRYKEEIKSGLDYCLNVEANIDQTGRAFLQDAVMSMLDEGVVALVPFEASLDPRVSSSYDILGLRTAKIIQWMPEHVQVELYNQRTGRRENMIFPKKMCAIVENPFYAIMNEPNSTLQRLIRKLALLDAVDDQVGAGKLDLIIQLPYVIKTEARRQQAEIRRKDIEMQLAGSKYGIAYTDGTEKITQLNRPLENNLMKQIEYLTNMLYGQLGITDAILNGSANEQEQLSYINHIVEPILSAFTNEMARKFLTKTARTQGQSLMFFRNPFKLVPINNIADIADKFTRNEILSSNEFRAIVGMKPVNDASADELRNKNINQAKEDGGGGHVASTETSIDSDYMDQFAQLDETEAMLEELYNEVDNDE